MFQRIIILLGFIIKRNMNIFAIESHFSLQDADIKLFRRNFPDWMKQNITGN